MAGRGGASVDLTEQVRTAHGDAWQVQGGLRTPYGGDRAELPGIRLMASGLPYPQWNNGDVTDGRLVDLEQVREWYSARGVPWGVRVPSDQPWPHGRHLFAKRLMGCTPADFTPRPPPDGCLLRQADLSDLGAVVAVDSVAFESDPAVETP